MRFAVVALAVAVLLGAAQDGKKRRRPPKDPSRGLSAPQLIAKALQEIAAVKGFHFRTRVSSQNFSGEYTGITKKDASAATGSAEIYARGRDVLVRSGDRFVTLKELDVQSEEGRAAVAFRNPAVQLEDIRQAASGAAFDGNDEKLGEIDCKVVRLNMSRQQLEREIRETVSRIRLPVPVGDPMQFIDLDRSKAWYRIWIGKQDLRIHKYEGVVEAQVREGIPLPPGVPQNFQSTGTTEISDYDRNLDWKIPQEVQQRLGIR